MRKRELVELKNKTFEPWGKLKDGSIWSMQLWAIVEAVRHVPDTVEAFTTIYLASLPLGYKFVQFTTAMYAILLGECSALWGEGLVWCISVPFFPLAYIYVTIVSFPGLPHLQLYPVKLQAENSRGRGYVGYQMYAGVCGAWYVLILGFIAHTLCHYCYCCRQQSLKAFGVGLKSCKSTSWYKEMHSVDFPCLQLIHILALSSQVMVYIPWIFAKHIQLWNQSSLSYGVRVV